MKFLSALVSAAAVSAAATKYPVYDVTEFSASCVPHSAECKYSFQVLQPGTMETHPVHCSALVHTKNGLLPDVKNAKCENSSRTFSVVRSKSGLTFSVSQPVSPISNTVGKHFIQNKELEVSKQPNAAVQSYKGPKAFKLY
ncbi:22kda glycoprotein [Fusarium austroafricanum]|uniref:22kda glycoprotein n=1 Tax=Fusarium austroafricanum TaxID=2364996 RepID=A0A8H4NT12_9HYPO|nr:22kda glycoprotein [Fusarium austroafricanum]